DRYQVDVPEDVLVAIQSARAVFGGNVAGPLLIAVDDRNQVHPGALRVLLGMEIAEVADADDRRTELVHVLFPLLVRADRPRPSALLPRGRRQYSAGSVAQAEHIL